MSDIYSFQEDKDEQFKVLTEQVKAQKAGVFDEDPIDQNYQDYLSGSGIYEKISSANPLNMDNPYHREYQKELNVQDRSEFTRGLLSGIDETQGMLYGAAGMVGSLTKIDSLRDWGFRNYKKNIEEAELNPVSINKIEDIDGIGDLGDWFGGTLGKLAPTMAEILVSAGIGAFMGSAATPAGSAVGGIAGAFNRGLVKSMLKKKLAKHLKSKVFIEIAEKQGKAVAKQQAKKLIGKELGRDVGIILGSSALESGGMWTEEAEKHGVENANAWSSLGLGLASGATELVSPSGTFIRQALGLKQTVKKMSKAQASKILKNASTKRFVGSMVKAMPGAMAGEGIQEVTQELISTLNSFINDPTVDFLSPENLSAFANSAAGGAAAGIFFAPFSGGAKYRASVKEAKGVVEKDQEEVNSTADTIVEDFSATGIADQPIQGPGAIQTEGDLSVEDIIKNATENAKAETGEFKEFSADEEFAMEISSIQKKLDNLQSIKKPSDKQKENIVKYKNQINELVFTKDQQTLSEEPDLNKGLEEYPEGEPVMAQEEVTDQAPTPEEQYTQSFLDMGMQENQAKASSKSLIKSFTDPEEAKAILRPGRDFERKIWQEETGMILPEDLKGTKEIIDQHLGESKIEKSKLAENLEQKANEEGLKPNITEEIKDIQSPEQELEALNAEQAIREQEEQEAIRQEALSAQNEDKNPRIQTPSNTELKETKLPPQTDQATNLKKGDLVSWKTKTGKELSGKILKKKKARVFVEMDNGKNTWIPEKSLVGKPVQEVPAKKTGKIEVQEARPEQVAEIEKESRENLEKKEPLEKVSSEGTSFVKGMSSLKAQVENKKKAWPKELLQETTEQMLKRTGQKSVQGKPTTEQSLETEAKKYGSAEEFIETQGERLYHGTGKDFDSFKPEGANLKKGKLGKGIYLTPSKKAANLFAKVRSKDTGVKVIKTVRVELKNPYVIAGEQNIPVSGISKEKLLALGYDGILLKDSNDLKTKEVVVYSPSQIKTESQLTDIWNKANPTTDKTSPVEKVGEEGYKTWYDTATDAKSALESMRSNGIKADHVGEAYKKGVIKYKIYRSEEEIDRLNKEFREKQEKEIAQKEQAEQKKKAIIEDIDGFDEGMNPMKRGSTIKILNKNFNFDDGLKSRKEKIRELVKEGVTLSTRQENKIKDMSRRAYNQADNAQQEEHERRQKEAGKKTVYYVGGYDLGKVAYDYADYLMSKNQDKSSPVEKKDVPIKESLTTEEEILTDKDSLQAEQSGIVSDTPQTNLANWVVNKLEKKTPIKSQDLFKQSDIAYKGTQGEGAYSVKDAYDAMELGINKFIERKGYSPNVDANEAQTVVNSLASHTKLLATQTKRTKEQNEYQQFSTPPAFAYIANWVGGVNKKDVMLEPSAGIGGIAIFAKNAGAKVFVNEFSERRASFLREMGFDKVFTEDAAQLDNVLPESVKPTVIIMNPPFSATAGRTSKNATMNGAKHIEQALSRLEPGGRLVAIVGNGMALDKTHFKKWWSEIKSEYNVRANIGVSGKEYTKYGTSFDNQLIVIDKSGETGNIIDGKVDSFSELIPALTDLHKEGRYELTKNQERQSNASESSSESGVDKTQGANRDRDSSLPTANELGGRESSGVQDGSTGTGSLPTTRDISTQNDKSDGLPVKEESASEPEGISTDLDTKSGVVDSGQSPGISSGSKSEIERADARTGNVKKEISSSVYDKYIPSVTIKGSKTHITPLVESAAMADSQAPESTYTPNLPKLPIKKGFITDAQLESIIYAGEAHQQFLKSGERKGFFIGDGTGVGKGREISGIIWDNFRKGDKKAIWLSEKASLLNDAKRDLKGIGWSKGADKVFGLTKTKLGERIKQRNGILFTQYATLRGKFGEIREDQEETLKDLSVRLNQITEWAGKDFDGVIAFDESHNMGNNIPLKGKRGTKKPASQALAGVMLQKLLPKAKVVYVSATGATEVANLAYATRLGLWGEGTPFKDVLDFVEQISGEGIAAMELVARDMKSLGMYLARSLSYADVKYERLEHKLSSPQTEIYDTLAKGWQLVLKNIDEAIEETDGGNKQRSAALSQFWGAHQRFFNQIVTAMQMPTVLKQMDKDIKDGKSIVVQLINTYASQLENEIASLEDGQGVDDIDMTPRATLMNFIERSFPVKQYEEFEDENGDVRTRPAYDSKGEQIINKKALEMRSRLLQEMGSVSVPNTALDMIVQEFGTDVVAEVTGRKVRIVFDKDGNKIIQKWSDAKAQKDIRDYMDDKKQILIFSDKGGTGASYHAAMDAKNQRLRRHYLVQPGWIASKAVQGLGRSHRSFQKQAPEFILATTNLPGQKRFLSSIARRLDQLGALTKGQRQTGSQGIFAAKDNLESSHAKYGLKNFFGNLLDGQYGDLSAEEYERQTGISFYDSEGNLKKELPEMTTFLNRMLSMTQATQDKVFDYFSTELDKVIQRHSDLGTLDVGLETITADSIKVVREDTAFKDEGKNIEAKYVQFELKHPNLLRVKFSRTAYMADNPKYFLNKTSKKIRLRDMGFESERTDPKTGEIKKYYKLTNPKGNTVMVESEAFEDKWEAVSKSKAKTIWDAEYKEAPKQTTENLHLLTGTLLPLWDRLDGRMAVARLQTDEGERYLGRKVSSESINSVLDNLGMDKEKIEMSGEQIADNVLAGGSVQFHNGIRLKRSKVAGENRIEYVSTDAYSSFNSRELEGYGLFSEQIQWKTRWFVPSGDNAIEVINHVSDGKDIVSVKTALKKTNVSDIKFSTVEEIKTRFKAQDQAISLDKTLKDDKISTKEKLNALYQSKKSTPKRNNQVTKRQRLREALKGSGDLSKTKLVTPKSRKQKAFAEIGKLFGLDVILFESTDPNINNINGFTYRGTNEIYVNLSGDNPVLSIIGHETMHQLATKHPDLYKPLLKALGINTKNYQQYYDKIIRARKNLGTGTLTEQEVFDEFVADFAGDQFLRPEFWQKLNKEKPGLVKKLVNIINDIIQKIKSISNRAEKHIINVEMAQDALVKAMGEFAVRENPFKTIEKTDSKAFKKWFGKSVAKTKGGKPVLFYHGGPLPITIFDRQKSKKKSDFTQPTSALGNFFTMDKKIADRYAGNGTGHVTEVYLKMEKPYKMSIKEAHGIKSAKQAELRQKALKRKGYDSIIMNLGKGVEPHVVVFESGQAKSPENVGTWDVDNPDIRFQVAEPTWTEKFKKWFGNSKVVDENGEPLVVYHGTMRDFTSFDPKATKKDSDQGWLGSGMIYFSEDPEVASAYSDGSTKKEDEVSFGGQTFSKNARVLPVYLSAEKIYRFPDSRSIPMNKKEADAFREELISGGYDGVYLPYIYDGKEVTKFNEVAVFNPNQIKSIYNQNPTKESNDIRYQTSEDVRGFEDSESTFLQKASDMVVGNWKHRKDKAEGREDLSLMAHVLQSTMYNAEKIGGAYKRLWNVIRKKDDYKKAAQRNLWFAGDESLLEGFKTFTKQFKKEYKVLSNYLHKKDVLAQGFIVKQKGDGNFNLLHWKKKNGTRISLGEYKTEKDAWDDAILIEARESGLSAKGQEALTLFRRMAHNLYDHYAEGMQETISTYEKAGQPPPKVTIQTEDGTTQINLHAAMEKMGDLRGHYFPRLRNSGKFKVYGYRKGFAPQEKFFDTILGANAYRTELERKGYQVDKVDKVGKISEDLFQSLAPLLAQQQVLNKALEGMSNKDKTRILEDVNIKGEWRDDTFVLTGYGIRADTEGFVRHLGGKYKERWIKNTYRPEIVFEKIPENTNPDEFEDDVTKAILHSGGLEVDMDLELARAMAKQYDTVLKSHGARARMIGRDGKKGINVIQGYEKDPLIAITQAMNAAAGSRAKSIIAKEGTAVIMGRDKTWKEYQENNADDTVKDLQEKLDSLDITSNTDKAKKKELVQELINTRNKLGDVENPSPTFIIKKQREIKSLLKQIKDLTKWADIKAAQNIKTKITQAKQEVYTNYLESVKGRQIEEKTQNKAYKEATATLKDILKNEEFADRVVGTLKGLAVWQYLGLRVSSAAVNVTNMGLGVPAAINGETKNKVSIGKALKFVGKGMKNYALHRAGKLTGEQKKVYDEIREKGWDDPQLNREAFDVLATKWGKGWQFALEKSMWMFGKTEEMNRAATIAATYFSMKDANKGSWDHDAMMEKARDISDKAHGSYGVANRPYQMRGDNLAARTLQMTYVFTTFSHNYLQEMYRLGFDKKQYKAALYMAFAPAIFGAGATVPMGIAKAMAKALGGDDPEEGLIDFAEQNFGMGDVARNGIMGAFDHGINLRGSLSTRFGVPSTFMDLFGAPGSVVADIWQGGKNLTKGYYVEGFEKMAPAAIGNISKGIRESTQGVTTKSGTPVFWGDKPLKGDSIDMIIRMLSFNPTNLSKKKEIQWAEYSKKKKYQEIKSDIYKRLKKFYSPTNKRKRSELIKIKADIRDFNIDIRNKNLTRIVSLITDNSIKNAMRRVTKAPKRERQRTLNK